MKETGLHFCEAAICYVFDFMPSSPSSSLSFELFLLALFEYCHCRIRCILPLLKKYISCMHIKVTVCDCFILDFSLYNIEYRVFVTIKSVCSWGTNSWITVNIWHEFTHTLIRGRMTCCESGKVWNGAASVDMKIGFDPVIADYELGLHTIAACTLIHIDTKGSKSLPWSPLEQQGFYFHGYLHNKTILECLLNNVFHTYMNKHLFSIVLRQ